MIIDFKMKPPLPGWETLFQKGKSLLNNASTSANTLQDVIAEMDAQGITSSVILGRNNEPGSSNEELLSFLNSPQSERFYGFIGIENMTVTEAVETIHRYAKTGLFRGVALNPGTLVPYTAIGDPSLDPIYEACLAYDLPYCITLSLLIGLSLEIPNYDYIRPSQLIRVAKKYPELKIIISHAAWPFVQEAIATAIHFRNIYLCPDLYIAYPESKLFAEAANFKLADQLLYASCYPNVPYEFALNKYKELHWDDGVFEKVLYTNAAKLLKL